MSRSYNELRQYYIENISSKLDDIKKIHPRHHVEFQEDLKKATSFIDHLSGEITFAIRMRAVIDDINSPPPCEVCGNPVVSVNRKKKNFTSTCSRKCQSILSLPNAIKTNLEKYGEVNPAKSKEVKDKISSTFGRKYSNGHPMRDENIKSKMREYWLEVYGEDNPMKIPHIFQKARDTMLKNDGYLYPMQVPKNKEKAMKSNMDSLGVPWPFMSPIVQKKIKTTNRLNYGVDYPMQSAVIRAKWLATNQEKYNDDYLISNARQLHISSDVFRILEDSDILQSYIDELGVKTAAHLLDVSDVTVYNYMRDHEIKASSSRSAPEMEIYQFIQDLGFSCDLSVKILNRQDIDIYVPEKKIGFEYNGLYWHSTKTKEIMYHRDKTKLAESKGIRLIQIFEDEWIEKREIVLKKISNILGIREDKVFARKTRFGKIEDYAIVREFMNNNHIQGAGPYGKYYGLYHDDELVSCMIMSKVREKGEGYWDLARFATSKNVIGGFSKLLKNVIRDLNPVHIQSFADIRWSQGDVYEKNGFTFEYDTYPSYFYIKGQKRIRKEQFRHARMAKMVDFEYDPTKTEKENTERNGFYRIYDCGLKKYVLDLS